MNIELHNRRVVAVDGGTATGKGLLIDLLAQLLRLKGVPVVHASTGSLYRAVAYAAISELVARLPAAQQADAVKASHTALERLRELGPAELMELVVARHIEMHGGQVWIDGAQATSEEHLKAPGVGMGASVVAGVIEVRHFINEVVRRQINEFDGFALIDGRDIGHTVVPDAPLKLLMTVAPEIAAQRSSEHTIEEIVARDTRDRARLYTHGQLKHPDDPGEGVIVFATDKHTPESMRDEVYRLMRQVFPELPPL